MLVAPKIFLLMQMKIIRGSAVGQVRKEEQRCCVQAAQRGLGAAQLRAKAVGFGAHPCRAEFFSLLASC